MASNDEYETYAQRYAAEHARLLAHRNEVNAWSLISRVLHKLSGCRSCKALRATESKKCR